MTTAATMTPEVYADVASAQLSGFLARVSTRGVNQIAHDISPKASRAQVDLNEERTVDVVSQAAAAALAELVGWNTAAAKRIAVALLEEVNHHAAAQMLADFSD
jgi:hypothetical protein